MSLPFFQLKKEGSVYDLPIALSILEANGTLKPSPRGMIVLGELALDGTVESQKKKIDEELRVYFADLFDDEADKEFYDILKSRTLEVLRGIAEGNPDEVKIERITRELMQHIKPKVFHGKDNAEVRYDKNFEKVCIALSEYTNANVKALTVSEFYSLYEYAKDVAKQQNKLKKR